MENITQVSGMQWTILMEMEYSHIHYNYHLVLNTGIISILVLMKQVTEQEVDMKVEIT